MIALIFWVIIMNLSHGSEISLQENMINEIESEIIETSNYTGIKKLSPKVLKALTVIPRHLFVPPENEEHAYLNVPLPIGKGQTISQPFIVALMTEILDIQPEDKILEIGTGSGYQAAILTQLANQVYTIEIIPFLAKKAKETLQKLGYKNIHVLEGDGKQGWAEHAPYNKIIVTAAIRKIPKKLLEQLACNGLMIIPLEEEFGEQFLTLISKDTEGKISSVPILSVRFVPFT